MNGIDEIAEKIAKPVKGKLDAKGFIISTIIIVSALVSIIYNLVKLNRMCKYSSKEALDHIREPNIVDKIKIRRVIRKSLKDQEVAIPKGDVGNSVLVVIEEEVSKAASLLDEKDMDTFIEIIKIVEKNGGFPKNNKGGEA